VVLVHGAFTDTSSWAGVIRRLHAADVPAQAVATPLRGLATDAAFVADTVAAIAGPVVLVGNSYAGAVIGAASATTSNVNALVHIAAFVPDEGESVLELAAQFPESELGAHLRPLGGDFYLSKEGFRHVLAADLPEDVTDVLAVSQRPIAAAALGEKSGPVGWKALPSWHAVAGADRAIHPTVQRFGARRAGSTIVEIDGSHLLALSQADTVTELILTAVTKSAQRSA
jgi:pimeloyl-ACP methyl ester carboxylesterase